VSQRLLRAWQHRGPLAWALRPVALVFEALVRGRRLAYQRHWLSAQRLPVPVVVVGNVVVGGAGKTPTVIALVQHLRQRGWTPGVVSRGHGRDGLTCHLAGPYSTPAEVGDEPALIRRATGAPLAVGRRRVDAARLLLQHHPEVDILISDDGMQHLALARDLTVVVFDERGVGNGWMLPAGMLREPWPSAAPAGEQRLLLRTLRQESTAASLPPLPGSAQAFVAPRTLARQVHDALGRTRDLEDFRGHPVGALAGIAQPQVFFEMLRARGLGLDAPLPLPDHASAAEMLAALGPGRPWLCTDKDAVKLFPELRDRPDLEVWAVPLEQQAEPTFWDALDTALKRIGQPLPRSD
jgi:tetraacyldisaccharide 4'-kinase